MKLKRRYMQTLGVSVKQLRKKLFELGARILHVKKSKQRDMALVVRVESVLLFFFYSTLSLVRRDECKRVARMHGATTPSIVSFS